VTSTLGNASAVPTAAARCEPSCRRRSAWLLRAQALTRQPLPGGERTIERLLSVDQTCRLPRRSLYGYLADVVTAKARGDPVPTLT
jgi:hypothetical protein